MGLAIWRDRDKPKEYHIREAGPSDVRVRSVLHEAHATVAKKPSSVEVRSLLRGAYLVGVILVAIPLLDTAVGAWPLRAGAVAWRFESAGVLLNVLVTPLLGAWLIALAAAWLGHRRAVLTMTWILGAATMMLVGVVGMFLLDYFQLRQGVTQQALAAFDAAAWKGILVGFLSTTVSGGLAYLGWKSIRTPAVGRKRALPWRLKK